MRNLFVLLGLWVGAGWAQDGLPDGARWISHLKGDLMPFWDQPSAFGSPVGSFLSTRCDDGSVLDYQTPCAELVGNYYLLTPVRYLVSVSRQTYGYGVAYHLTGDARYLGYMKAGVDFIRKNAEDPQGGMFTQQDLRTGQWGPARELRNPQELGYGLLGMAFYYYLTRDAEVLPDILTIRDYILSRYWNNDLGAMQWNLAPNANDQWDKKELVAVLDQLNTYMVLLTPILPEPYQGEWKSAMNGMAHAMIDQFYSPKEGLFFLEATTAAQKDLSRTGTDFGHNAKALWMIRWIGRLTGDDGLVRFAEGNAPKLFERAYLADEGSWAQGLLAGGATDRSKSWWIYAELDQYSGTLGLKDRAFADRLAATNRFWFDRFVDPQYGEVWNGLDAGTNRPVKDFTKQWPWKNAYHSFEHTLVGYITGQQLSGQATTLYYAFSNLPEYSLIRPYYFSGDVQQASQTDSGGWAVTFGNIQ